MLMSQQSHENLPKTFSLFGKGQKSKKGVDLFNLDEIILRRYEFKKVNTTFAR